MTREITCEQFIAYLDEFAAGTIPPAEREVFEAHLKDCAHCRAYLKEYQRTIELAASLCDKKDGAIPADVPRGLVDAVRKAIAAREAKP